MKLININNQKTLDDFVGRQQPCQFLQSWSWADFQEQTGNQVFRLGVEEDGQLIASAVLIKKTVLGFKYFYCPRGPIVLNNSGNGYQILNFFFSKIRELSTQEDVKFLRFEPRTVLAKDELKDWSMVQTIDVQPKQSLVLDLTKTEGELLSAMHQKTRYNIRLAERKGVEIISYSGQWEEVWRIMQATKSRDGFALHSSDYYQKIIDSQIVKVFLAKYEGRIIAVSLAVFFNNCAVYLHGGSANEQRQVMAPYLLQWQMIKEAQQAGCKYYDFYGIDAKKWPGVTKFKQGFAGQVINYAGTFDLIFSPVYYMIYKIVRKLRRLF